MQDDLFTTFALAAAFVLGGALGYAAGHGSPVPLIGSFMPDGTVYAGVSTGLPLFTMPAGAPGTYTWDEGTAHCAALDSEGHKDWRVPTKGELNVLFQNRAAIGGFNESGSIPAGRYWSSTQDGYFAWIQSFSDGSQHTADEYKGSSLRCVR